MGGIFLANPNIKLKKRLMWVLGIFTFCTTCLIFRVAWIQIANGQEYQQEAIEQQTVIELLVLKEELYMIEIWKP